MVSFNPWVVAGRGGPQAVGRVVGGAVGRVVRGALSQNPFAPQTSGKPRNEPRTRQLRASAWEHGTAGIGGSVCGRERLRS